MSRNSTGKVLRSAILGRAIRAFAAQVSNRVARDRRRNRARRMLLETLECRWTMTAEGSQFNLSRSVDASGLSGALVATATWGDGTQSNLAIGTSGPASTVRFKFDYSFDSNGFFSQPSRRTLLEEAAETLASKLTDSLSAISPSGTNTWTAQVFHPANGSFVDAPVKNIAANEIYVYAGGRDLPGTSLGSGGPGGYRVAGSQTWIDTIAARGQTGALASTPTDFGPWGGSITFDTNTNWHFGTTTAGLESDEQDFYSVALHELTHLLGFGVSSSWNRYLSGNNFTGPASKAANGGANVPLEADRAHWKNGLFNNGQETLMDPTILAGQRKLLTELDVAGLKDLGWSTTNSRIQVSGSHIYADNGTYPLEIQIQGSTPGVLVVDAGSAVITNAVPTLSDPADANLVVGQTLSVPTFATFSDPGFGSTETFTYSIDWGDGEAVTRGDATITRAGAAGVPTLGRVGVAKTFNTAGRYTGTLTLRDDDGGTATQTFVVNVTAAPSIALALSRNTFAENAGSSAATLTITARNISSDSPTAVTLTSSDPTEATVQSQVFIPAGQSSVTVPINAIDDDLLDGVRPVTITATIGGTTSATIGLTVTDYETVALSLNRSDLREDMGNGAAVLTVRRSNSDVNSAVNVALVSGDITEIAVPATVTIPAGAQSINVGVTAVDDQLLDGTIQTTLTASAVGYVGAQIALSVADHEPIAIVSDLTTLMEGVESSSSATIKIDLPGPAPAGGTVVELSTVPSRQLDTPASIVIPAGQDSATLEVALLDDNIVEGTGRLTLTAFAEGYVSTSFVFQTIDDDTSPYTNSSNRLDVDGKDGVTVLDVLAVINALNRYEIGPVSRIPVENVSYIDTNGDGVLSPLDVLFIINYLNAQSRKTS